MRFGRAAALGLAMLVVAASAVYGSTAAFSQDATPTIPKDYKELLELFGIADSPVDFVIVIDTSSSMQAGPDPFYPKVQEAYGGFVDSIRPADYLSVIRFDTQPLPLFSGSLESPEQRATALNALPKVADGQNTDIGKALNDTLDRLERPGGNEVQLVIFLTDGKQEPGPGSPYGREYGPAWEPLHERAKALEKNHQLWAYGAGLSNGQPTDIDLLGRVFARAKLVGLPPDQLPAFFREAIEKARIEQLRTPFTEEINETEITSSVSAVGALGDTITFDAIFSSTAKKLPVSADLKGVTVTDAQGNKVKAELEGGRKTLLIGPNGTSKPMRVVAHPALKEHGREFGTSTETEAYKVDFDIDTIAEPHDLARVLLDIETTVKHTPPPDPSAFSREVGISYRTVLFWVIIGLLSLALVAAFLVWATKLPPLRGALERSDESLVPLRGTQQLYPDRKHPDVDAYGAQARFFTKRRKWRKVFVATKQPVVEFEKYKRFSVLAAEQRLTVGSKVKIGDAVVRWTPRSKGGSSGTAKSQEESPPAPTGAGSSGARSS